MGYENGIRTREQICDYGKLSICGSVSEVSFSDDVYFGMTSCGFFSRLILHLSITFCRLFKGKSAKLWTEVMTKVKPKEEVLAIQKNLLVKQLRAGVPLAETTASFMSRLIVFKLEIFIFCV